MSENIGNVTTESLATNFVMCNIPPKYAVCNLETKEVRYLSCQYHLDNLLDFEHGEGVYIRPFCDEDSKTDTAGFTLGCCQIIAGGKEFHDKMKHPLRELGL